MTRYDAILRAVELGLPSAQPHDIPQLLSPLPLKVWGEFLLSVPDSYPNLKAFFPSMPPDAIQDSWTGAHGTTLLAQSVAFIESLATGYQAITGQGLEQASVLDFGCGWGRLIRLLYKYVACENIYAVDPLDQSIALCQQHGIKAHLALSDYVPTTLPFERQFDLIYAFSVFTHLSEKTAHIALKTLRRYIVDAGILVITIRPKEYWQFHMGGAVAEDMISRHDRVGFAFMPHNRPPIDGDITYGDTSISMEYFVSSFPQWKLISTVTNKIDSYQVLLFLRPA